MAHKSLEIKLEKFIKKATVRGDMARRVMYSLIPLVNDNKIDNTALKYAVEGINDLIKYGATAAVGELEHYQFGSGDENYDYYDEDDNPIEKEYENENLKAADSALKNKDYHTALEIANACFNDDSGWHQGYGGEAWARITRSLLNLSNHKQALRHTILNKDLDGELQVMKDIIVEMNIFDGLSHNTASVMRNIIEEENKDLKPSSDEYFKSLDEFKRMDLSKLSPQQIKKLKEKFGPIYNSPKSQFNEAMLDYNDVGRKEKTKIFNMMDAKELSDPIDVYREIEQSLIESGDINKYHDHVSKLRNNPKYTNYDFDKLENEKNLIKLRKKILPKIKTLNKLNDDVENLDVNDFTHDPDTSNVQYFYYGVSGKIQNLMTEIDNFRSFILDSDSGGDSNFFDKNENKRKELKKNTTKLENNCLDLYNKLKNDMYNLAGTTKDDLKISIVEEAKKELKSLIYKTIFVFESI